MSRHSFSIEIKKLDHIANIQLCNDQKDKVFIEGDLGEQVRIEFIEGVLLQITGNNGVFRMDLTENELIYRLEKEFQTHTA